MFSPSSPLFFDFEEILLSFVLKAFYVYVNTKLNCYAFCIYIPKRYSFTPMVLSDITVTLNKTFVHSSPPRHT